MPFRSTRDRISASSTPSIEPAPPKMSTPPRTTAVTTSISSDPCRRVGSGGAEEAEVDDGRDPGHEAGEREDRDADLRHRDPENRAASRFEPIANR